MPGMYAPPGMTPMAPGYSPMGPYGMMAAAPAMYGMAPMGMPTNQFAQHAVPGAPVRGSPMAGMMPAGFGGPMGPQMSPMQMSPMGPASFPYAGAHMMP